MVYMHESNIQKKIDSNYNGFREELEKFYEEEYMVYRNKLNSLDFSSEDITVFEEATKLIN